MEHLKLKDGRAMAKKSLTMGKVAEICEVSPQTARKWFESGLLVGYRIPGSADRRVPKQNLIKFLKEHGMPLNGLEDSGDDPTDKPNDLGDGLSQPEFPWNSDNGTIG